MKRARKFLIYTGLLISMTANACPDIEGNWTCKSYVNYSDKIVATSGWLFEQKALDNGDTEYTFGIPAYAQKFVARSGTIIRTGTTSTHCDVNGLTIYSANENEASQMTISPDHDKPEQLIVTTLEIGITDFPFHVHRDVCTKEVLEKSFDISKEYSQQGKDSCSSVSGNIDHQRICQTAHTPAPCNKIPDCQWRLGLIQ
jgi:hypothetical protein